MAAVCGKLIQILNFIFRFLISFLLYCRSHFSWCSSRISRLDFGPCPRRGFVKRKTLLVSQNEIKSDCYSVSYMCIRELVTFRF
jgi:hypothetical protein